WGAGTDEFRITNAATITDAQFANKTTVETLALGADANAQTVTLGALSQTAGIVTVDASAVTTGANAVTVDLSARTTGVTVVGGAGNDVITAGSGADNLSGGGGADSFRFASANFAATDAVTGGAGVDEIRFSTAATLTDAQFAAKSTVENLVLGDFAAQSVTLAGNSDAAGIVLVDASALAGTNAVTVDVSGRATTAVTVIGGAGADVMVGSSLTDDFTGNAGADSFRFANANFQAADVLAGGTGTDEIRITDAATVVDAQLANKGNIQNLVLGANASGQTITLGARSEGAGIVTVDASAVTTAANAVT